MSHELGAESDIHTLHGGEAAGHFRGTVAITFTELVLVAWDGTHCQLVATLQLLEVRYCQLEHVRLLQLGDGFSLSL